MPSPRGSRATNLTAELEVGENSMSASRSIFGGKRKMRSLASREKSVEEKEEHQTGDGGVSP